MGREGWRGPRTAGGGGRSSTDFQEGAEVTARRGAVVGRWGGAMEWDWSCMNCKFDHTSLVSVMGVPASCRSAAILSKEGRCS